MKNFLSCGILFFFLPVLLAFCWNGGTTVWGNSQTSDIALTVMLYQNSPQNEQPEALKAEAVVFRTVLEHYDAEEWHKLLQTCVNVVQEKAYIEKRKMYEQAVYEAANIQVKKGATEVYLPYHSISAGRTRESKYTNLPYLSDEVSVTKSHTVNLQNMQLVSVESPWDRDATGFQQIFSFTEKYIQYKVFTKDAVKDATVHIQDIQMDTAGYVQYIQTEYSVVSGDQIRELLGLSSSCFTIHREGERWIFTCLGVGHGYGMSLYGCEILAKEGKSCQEILNYYFPQCEFSFIRR